MLDVLTDNAHPVDQTGWAFYFRLFLLSRKAINATIRLPKDISKANIPIKIETISYAVMGVTSFPLYSGIPVLQFREAVTPVVSAFLSLFYHTYFLISIYIRTFTIVTVTLLQLLSLLPFAIDPHM